MSMKIRTKGFEECSGKSQISSLEKVSPPLKADGNGIGKNILIQKDTKDTEKSTENSRPKRINWALAIKNMTIIQMIFIILPIMSAGMKTLLTFLWPKIASN